MKGPCRGGGYFVCVGVGPFGVLSPSGPGIQAGRGRGPPAEGGPANPEPKTLNHVQRQRVTLWGYALATLKVVWVPAIP